MTMAMSEEEILREAARIQASRRKRTAKTCQRCGTDFIGVAQAKYCSDACRMAAAREQRARRAPDPEHAYYIRVEPRLPGESLREWVIRQRAKRVARGEITDEQAALTLEDERAIEASERLDWLRENVFGDNPFDVDSTEVLRREREERSAYQQSLHE